LRAMMGKMAENFQPTYMQLVRSKVNKVFDEDCNFEPGKSVVLREGSDVTLVTTGYMTQFAVEVADQVKEEGLSIEVLHCGSIKPFDAEALLSSVKKTGAVVTVENQSIMGGLGGVVCETLSEQYPASVRRLGIPDRFGEVATEKYLFDKHKFGSDNIIDACRKQARSK